MSKDSCGSKKGFFLAVAASDIRDMGTKLKAVLKEDQEVNDTGKWETGMKGPDFPPFKKVCFARFTFSSGLVSLKNFSP